MSKMARSQSCQDDGGMSNCSSNPSHSPASSLRMMQEKRDRRSIDRKHVGGGVESRSIKDEHAVERGRSRSKSPRRNSWREEIKQIKSWKDERENREIKFEDIRHDRQARNRSRASQRSSKCSIKDVKAINKFDLLPRRKFMKKEARLVKVTPCRGIKKSCEKKERLPPPLVFQTRGERLSRWKQVKKSSNVVNDVVVGLVTRRKAERKDLDKSQTNQDMMASGEYGSVLGRSSKDFADSDDELELRISDKDIFPELRNEQVDRVCAVPDMSMDGMEGKITKNYEGSKIMMKKPEGDDYSSQRSVKLVDDSVKNVKDEKKTVRRDSKLNHEISTVVMDSLDNEESCTSSTSSDSMMRDEDSSAMARNFSLLELKMEVYTTRLKELEWEREQLRKEREVFKDKELFVKRDLMKSLLEQKMLTVNFNLCEKENKENKENKG